MLTGVYYDTMANCTGGSSAYSLAADLSCISHPGGGSSRYGCAPAADCAAISAHCTTCLSYTYCLTSPDANCANAPQNCESCLAYIPCGSGASSAYEWAGIFSTPDSSYTWRAQQVNGMYADPTMRTREADRTLVHVLARASEPVRLHGRHLVFARVVCLREQRWSF